VTSQVHVTYSKNTLLSSASEDAISSDFLAQSVRELWPIITLKAITVDSADLKGFWGYKCCVVVKCQITPSLFVECVSHMASCSPCHALR